MPSKIIEYYLRRIFYLGLVSRYFKNKKHYRHDSIIALKSEQKLNSNLPRLSVFPQLRSINPE